MRRTCRSLASTLSLTAALLVGCAGDGPEGGDQPGWLDEIQRNVFDPSCISEACHSASTRAGDLSLVAGESYDQLVNIAPENAAARAEGLLRVLPGSIEQSFLVPKLTGELGPGEGSLMPLGSSRLSTAQIADVEAWILAGAPRDAPAPGGP